MRASHQRTRSRPNVPLPKLHGMPDADMPMYRIQGGRVNPWPITGCTACALHTTRKRMVGTRGHTPASVLFLVEAPTMADEALGRIMVGQADKFLVNILAQAAETAGIPTPEYHISPMVFCRPTNGSNLDNREPKPQEIIVCMKNVMRVVMAVNPRLTVLVGPLVRDNYARELPESVYILPPGFLMKQPARYNVNMRNLAEALRKYAK